MKNQEMNILIVDDEDAVRGLMAKLLELEDFNVFQADSVEKALPILKSEKIHFVLSDIRMPDQDGIDLLKAIRSNHPKIPIVCMMTGFSDYSQEEILELGALRVLAKPFDIDDLIETIIKAVNEAFDGN